MARKGQFKKGGGRHGGPSRSRSRSRRTTTAIVVAAPRAPARRRRASMSRRIPGQHAHKPRRHHRGGGRGGITLPKLVATGLILSNVAGTNNGPLGDKVYNLVQKIPGAKTFGGAAVAGLSVGALYKFTRFGGRFRPWMATAGVIGVVAAILKVGEQGTAFKWLGDSSDAVMDVET